MELKNIFKMTKTDRYTQDGRDEIAKLQETEDVKYKTGDISQKTGLQKQPDGSWAPPKKGSTGRSEFDVEGREADRKEQKKAVVRAKRDEALKQERREGENRADDFRKKVESGEIVYNNETGKFEEGSKPAAKKEAGSINRTPERIAKETAIMEALNLSTGEDNNLHKMSDETIERLYARTQEKPAAGSKPATSKPDTKEQAKALMEKYKDLPGAQKKDALYAATFEGSPIGMTQNQMERQGWDLVQADDDVNVYAKPDGSKVTMKHDGNKITSSEYEAPGSKPAGSSREARVNEYWSKMRKETQPVARMAAELDRGTFDDDVINTMGDGQSMEDLARSLISPAFEEDGYIPQDKLDTARKIIRKRYRALESDATDAAPKIRELTGDCKIKIRQTQDVKYNTGDISQKTGLQKQPDGSWAPPKNQGRTFQFEVGENGQAKPGTGKEVKTYRTKKEALGALKTFNKMTGSNKSDFESVKSEYNKALEKNTGRSAAGSKAPAGSTEKPAASFPPHSGMDAEQYDKKLRQEGWKQTGEYAQNKAGHNVGYFEKNGKRIQVVENSEGRIAGVDEVKPKTYTSKEGRRNFRAALEDNPKDAYDFSKTVEHSIPMSAGDKEQLANIKSFMQDENTDYKDAIKSVATGLVNGNQMRGDWYPEKEQSVLKIAKSVGLEKELMNYIKANHKGYEFGYSEDSAPRILTGDTKIRIRK